MRVEVFFQPAVPVEHGRGRELAILVDVLRTSTTLAVAFAHRARAVVPCATPEEACRFAEASTEPVLLAGEQGGKPIPGFALENSPREYVPEVVAGKLIAFVSSNGTPLLRRLPDGDSFRTVVAGLVNRAAVVEYCRRWGPERVWICCAGDGGSVAYEDVLGAGALVEGLSRLRSVVVTDAAQVAAAVYREASRGYLEAVLRASRHARFLALEGKQHDIEDALRLDTVWVVPRWVGGFLLGEEPACVGAVTASTPECAA